MHTSAELKNNMNLAKNKKAHIIKWNFKRN